MFVYIIFIVKIDKYLVLFLNDFYGCQIYEFFIKQIN
jgi:hypothetical protein